MKLIKYLMKFIGNFMIKNKKRKSRIAFCEWNSATIGLYNIGGYICENCNFHRTILRNEGSYSYEMNNKIERDFNCPQCKENNWYWLPPIARVPRKSASKRIWKKFWNNLKSRKFNHPKTCR